MHTPCLSPPFCTYILGNLIAAVGFLAVWAIALLLESWTVLALVVAFPALMLCGLLFLFALSGWRQVLTALCCWPVVWFAVYLFGVVMLFRIAGPP